MRKSTKDTLIDFFAGSGLVTETMMDMNFGMKETANAK